MLNSEVFDEIRRIEANVRDTQKAQLGWMAEVLGGLAAEGKLAGAVRIQTSICQDALLLGQMVWVQDGDFAKAQAEFCLPIDTPGIPRFDEVVQSVTEGMRGERPWNGVKLNLDGQIYRVLCYLLARRDKELVHEYRDVDRDNFFDPVDAVLYQSVFCKQLLMAVNGRFDRISLEAYKGTRLKKTSELYGYHLMLDAIARSDANCFGEELARYVLLFKKRKSSNRDSDPWGYGSAAHYSFDIVGTVLCRLASQRGLQFADPDPRYIPVQFWKPV